MSLDVSISSLGSAPRESTGAKTRSLAPVRAWLWTVAACIFAMVVVGGATRLTQSGLSITEWKPVMGVVPPLGEADWQTEFDKYKAIPQYAQLNADMDLAGFKSIFYWEWAHRLLGRTIGVLFALPLAWFWLTGRLSQALKPRLLGLLALGGLQGLIGWWMVKSGLSERVSVSQYRLAVHLVTASITFAYALWLAEGLCRPDATAEAVPVRLRLTAAAIVGAVFVQLGLGALVAGLHAGLLYNTWPLMGDSLVPPLRELAFRTPVWVNAFENGTTAQFDHRLMAYAVTLLVLLHAADAWLWRAGSAFARRAALLLAFVLAQVAIGITTLLLVVPLPAALLHQAFAIVLLGAAVVHLRRSTPPVRQSSAAPALSA